MKSKEMPQLKRPNNDLENSPGPWTVPEGDSHSGVSNTSERKKNAVEADASHPYTQQLGHFAAIVESSDDAIISKTLEGIVTSWNNSAERIFGYTAQEMIGVSITKIVPPDRQEEEPQILERLKKGNG